MPLVAFFCCGAEFLWIWRPVQRNVESLLGAPHHPLEDLRLQKSRFSAGFALSRQHWDRPNVSLCGFYSHSCRPQVCFRDAFFSLLPRMRYGLFYNTPLVSSFWQTHAGLRENLHAQLLTFDPFQSSCKLPGLQISLHLSLEFRF